MFNTVLRAMCLLCVAAVTIAPALAADPPTPPDAFARLVPTGFGNGLELVQIRKRCDGCPPWRTVNFPQEGSSAPARQEKVSVREGVTAMYAFPGTQYFANTKVEQSVAGRYEQDKAVVLEALSHQCDLMKAHAAAYVAAHLEAREKLDRAVATGKPWIEFEQGTYRAYEYAFCSQNVAGMGGAPGEVLVFVPGSDVIVTTYLLSPKITKFKTADEFVRLRREFIEGYIDFLAKR